MNSRNFSGDKKEKRNRSHGPKGSDEKRLRPGRPVRHNGRETHEDTWMTGGRNSVVESMRAGHVRKIFVKSGEKDGRLQDILKEAVRLGLSVTETSEEELDAMTDGVRHQGIAALLKPYVYAELERVLAESEKKDPILVLLDGVEDVRNLGAIVRTAECAGVTAVLLPRHKSSPVTAAAMKTAAGAFAYLPVCEVGNIRQTLEMLKGKGFWVAGADMDGDDLYHADLKGPLVIVMGAEGKGISPLTKKMCDFCVRIPMQGKVSSLNVSVAAALLIYEAVRQRN